MTPMLRYFLQKNDPKLQHILYVLTCESPPPRSYPQEIVLLGTSPWQMDTGITLLIPFTSHQGQGKGKDYRIRFKVRIRVRIRVRNKLRDQDQGQDQGQGTSISAQQSRNAVCALQINCKLLLFPCRNPVEMSR